MKYFYFVALAAVFPPAVVPQVPDSSGLAVVKKEWRMTRTAPSSVLIEDPFDAVERSTIASRIPKTTNQQNRERTQNGLPPGFTADHVEPPTISDRTLSVSAAYVYEIRIRNDGSRTVKNVIWDYVFYDPATGEEVGRRRFLNAADLKPGKLKSLASRVVSPPTGTIDARTAGKRNPNLFIEQIMIKGVEFADGSVWEPDLPTALLKGPRL